jgi:hypothetical protein
LRKILTLTILLRPRSWRTRPQPPWRQAMPQPQSLLFPLATRRMNIGSEGLQPIFCAHLLRKVDAKLSELLGPYCGGIGPSDCLAHLLDREHCTSSRLCGMVVARRPWRSGRFTTARRPASRRTSPGESAWTSKRRIPNGVKSSEPDAECRVPASCFPARSASSRR